MTILPSLLYETFPKLSLSSTKTTRGRTLAISATMRSLQTPEHCPLAMRKKGLRGGSIESAAR